MSFPLLIFRKSEDFAAWIKIKEICKYLIYVRDG